MTLWASGYRNLLANRRRMMEAGVSSGQSYIDRVLGYAPIAYWPLNETSGTTAICQVNPAQNGTYTNATVGQVITDAVGVSFVCPFFDAVGGDRVNIWSATFRDAFNNAEGTLMAWARVFNAGIWTDSTRRKVVQIRTDNNNKVLLERDTTNNEMRWGYTAGGDFDEYDSNTLGGSLNWEQLAITWSDTANNMHSFANGVDLNTRTPIGAWVGAIVDANTKIGSGDAFNSSPWHGWISNVAVFGSALAQPIIADLATV